MTITATPSEVSYLGDGVTLAFAIPFVFDTSADILVITTDSDGEPTEIVTGFAITGGGGSTGTCTFDVAPASGVTLTMLDNPELTQTADYTANDDFPADAHEAALDRTVRQVKRLNQRIDRSLRVADGDLSSGDNLLIPITSTRAGMVLGFDSVGQPTVVEPGGGADSALRTDLANTLAGADGARLVGFNRNDTGSIARSVYAKLYDRVSVSDFGAAPSASAAINAAAINAALALASHVHIDRPGTYVINTNLDMAEAGTLEIGPGVILQAAASGTWIGTIGKGIVDINGKNGCRITGSGTIDGNKVANAAGRHWGVRVKDAARTTLDGRIYCINCPGQDATGINQGDGLVVYGTSSDFYCGAWVFYENVRQGASIVECNGFKFVGTVFASTTGSAPGAGVDVEADVPGNLKNGEFIGCTFRSNYISVQLADCDHVKFLGCKFIGARWNEIHAIRSTNIYFDSACTIEPAPTVAQTAIAHFFECVRVTFEADITGTYDAQEGAGVYLNDGCAKFLIRANIRSTYSFGIQIGKDTLAEDIDEVVVESHLENCTDSAVNLPMIFVGGNATNYPRRLRIMRNTSISDNRVGALAATAGVQVSTNIPAAVVATYRIEPGYISGPAELLSNPPLWGVVLWNPASAGDGGGETSPDITVTGATVGDHVEVYPPENLLGVTHSAYVSAANTVKIRIQNESGGAQDLSNSNWYVRVRKRYE